MIDDTANAFADLALAILPADHAHPRGDLGKLPSPLAHYLGSLLDRKADRKVSAPESPWVDSNHELVVTASKVWKTAARAAAQFPEEAWANAVRTASRQVLNYLVEPVETLVSFAFTDAGTKLELDALQESMSAFSPYPYFREVAEGYVERKALDGIDRAEFEKLLQRIDKRMVGRFSTSDWLTLLEPLYELVAAIPGYEEGVPGEILKRFFVAKGVNEMASVLNDGTVYDEEKLQDALVGVAKPKANSAENAIDEPASPVEDSKTEAAENHDTEPIWQRLAREKAGGRSAQNPDKEENDLNNVWSEDVIDKGRNQGGLEDEPSAMPLPDASQNEIEDAEIIEEPDVDGEDEEDDNEVGGGEPLWKQFAGGQKPEKSADASPIQSDAAIPPSDDSDFRKRPEPLLHLEMRVLGSTALERRDWYSQHLTKGSEAAYRAVLEDLDRARDWNEAWPILKEAYQTNKVEIYNEAMVAFTDAVEERYRS